MIATRKVRTKVVSLLLETGANTDLQNMVKMSVNVYKVYLVPLTICMQYILQYHILTDVVCNEPFCQVISISLYMSVITQGGDSALMIAARLWDSIGVVWLLLEAGANIHLQNKVKC